MQTNVKYEGHSNLMILLTALTSVMLIFKSVCRLLCPSLPDAEIMRMTNCSQMIHGSVGAFMLLSHFAGRMMDVGLGRIMNHINVFSPVTVETCATKPGS